MKENENRGKWLPCARLTKYGENHLSFLDKFDNYQWNIELSAAMLPALHYLEIVLRNKIDALIKALYGDDWLITSPSELIFSEPSRKAIEAVKEHLAKQKKNYTHQDVLVQLSFGFWTDIFHKRYSPVLWNKSLPGTRPKRWVMGELLGAKGNPRAFLHMVSEHLRHIKTIRNRIAHHEPVWHEKYDICSAHQKALRLLRTLSLDAYNDLLEVDHFISVYQERDAMRIPMLAGLGQIADKYDAYLLDLWGVIHDGTHLYPGAKEALVQLRARGAKVLFLSNAPRRAQKVIAVLDQLGISPLLYDGVVSSGEAGFMALKSGKVKFGGTRYYYIGPEKDRDVLDGLDYTPVATLAEADFLLNVGFGSEEQSMRDWSPLLHEAKRAGLPMLCLNPDMEVVKISGERHPCAGVIAQAYETLGGDVTWYGKPYPDVYDYALSLLGHPQHEGVLAIGDGLHTDIQGAVNAKIDCALVTGGILKQELGDVHPQAILTYLSAHDAQPDYILPGLVW